MKSSLIILTYNEIDGVKHMFPLIPPGSTDEILVIDGGSTDGTLEYFRDHNIKTIVQQKKKGRGEAFRIAYQEAAHDALLFFSPDGNEDPNDIPKILGWLDQGFDMVIGSRFMPGSRNEEDDKFFPSRKWANQIFTFIANSVWNHEAYITDTINGYRAITKKAFALINPDADGYAIEFQMSIRGMKVRLKTKEIPTIEADRVGGQSKALSIPTGLRFVRLLAHEIMVGNKIAPIK